MDGSQENSRDAQVFIKILLHKFKHTHTHTCVILLRGSEENTVLLCPEDIRKGFAMKLSCGYEVPQTSLNFFRKCSFH